MFKTCMTQLNTTGFLIIEPHYIGGLLGNENLSASQTTATADALTPALSNRKGLRAFFCLLDRRKGQVYTYSDESLAERVALVTGRTLVLGEECDMDASTVLRMVGSEWTAHPLYPESLDCERAKERDSEYKRRVAAREAARLESESAAS
ncbi:hypothetical protein [Methyloglobulus sp.]|uniref:hypothetical protein n=1 Tax=Methyloglobulus sp. TaxID=2518622 RepID=UPI0032B85F54